MKLFLLKLFVSLGLLAFLFSRVDLAKLLQALSSARPSYLVVALLGYFLGQVVSSVRWALLARPLGFQNPLRDFTVFYFIGMFFNLFAPSTVGGDVGRVFYLARGGAASQDKGWTRPTVYALMSVVTDRAVGMAVLVWIGAVALFTFPSYRIPSLIRYPTFALALGFILGWLLLPLVNGFLQRREHPWGQDLRLVIEAYWGNQQIILQTISLSLFVHFLQTWIQILLGQALDVTIPWSYGFILYPLVGVFSALPVSVNGIGLREGGYLFLLGRIDISPEKAIAFGILWFVIVVLESMIGGLVFILAKSPRPSDVLSEIKDQVR